MMNLKSTKPLQLFISDYQNTESNVASVVGVVLEARSYRNVSNPANDVGYAAAFPISHAPVYLADAKDGCYIASGLTDNDGNFIFQNISNGWYCIKVDHDGSTICDEKNQIRIDDNVQNLDVKAIISKQRMITRVRANSLLNQRSPMEEGLCIELSPEYDGRLKLKVNMPFNHLKMKILDLSGWIVFIRDYKKIPEGYEDLQDLNHLDPGTYIMHISGSNYLSSKKLILQ
jgi:hypothetical protein